MKLVHINNLCNVLSQLSVYSAVVSNLFVDTFSLHNNKRTFLHWILTHRLSYWDKLQCTSAETKLKLHKVIEGVGGCSTDNGIAEKRPQKAALKPDEFILSTHLCMLSFLGRIVLRKRLESFCNKKPVSSCKISSWKPFVYVGSKPNISDS